MKLHHQDNIIYAILLEKTGSQGSADRTNVFESHTGSIMGQNMLHDGENHPHIYYHSLLAVGF